jgi:hypothetical protein
MRTYLIFSKYLNISINLMWLVIMVNLTEPIHKVRKLYQNKISFVIFQILISNHWIVFANSFNMYRKLHYVHSYFNLQWLQHMTPAVNISKLHTLCIYLILALRIKNKISLHIICSFVFITVLVCCCGLKTTFIWISGFKNQESPSDVLWRHNGG